MANPDPRDPYQQSLNRLLGGGGYVIGGSSAAFPVTVNLYGPATPSTEYKGIPFDFTLGEVYGLRVWIVDSFGRLRARHVVGAPAWRPTGNVAGCYSSGSATKPETHETPHEDCNCGFYAYSEVGFVDEQIRGAQTIVGVIKGSGRTLLGTKGFRCEKADIVALQNPGGAGEGPRSSAERKLSERLSVVYPDVPQLPTRAALLEFAPVNSLMPGPGEEGFWDIP